MTFDTVEALGLVAGVVSTFASAPQLIKILRTRSAADVSLAMFVMALAGTVLWGAYGWLKDAPSILFWNSVAFFQFVAIIVLKVRHTQRGPDPGSDI
jgi:MtN3 and saliva related transmembrane protein